VIRFDLNTKKIVDIFVSGAGCACLDRPGAVVFGPDQRLYVANSVLPVKTPMHRDNIVIFDGTKPVVVPPSPPAPTIDLGDATLSDGTGVFNLPSALLFGPGGLLYVNIVQYIFQNPPKNTTGAVFRCSVTTKNCNMKFVPLNSTLQQRPTGLTFGSTNPATLVYENNDQNND
jgi:hypothetical protein